MHVYAFVLAAAVREVMGYSSRGWVQVWRLMNDHIEVFVLDSFAMQDLVC